MVQPVHVIQFEPWCKHVIKMNGKHKEKKGHTGGTDGWGVRAKETMKVKNT